MLILFYLGFLIVTQHHKDLQVPGVMKMNPKGLLEHFRLSGTSKFVANSYLYNLRITCLEKGQIIKTLNVQVRNMFQRFVSAE